MTDVFYDKERTSHILSWWHIFEILFVCLLRSMRREAQVRLLEGVVSSDSLLHTAHFA